MASKITKTRDGDMITRVSSSLVQEADRLTIQGRKLSLETNVANPGDIVFAVTPVILKEKSDGRSSVPMGAIQRQLEDIGTGHRSGDLDGLGWG